MAELLNNEVLILGAVFLTVVCIVVGVASVLQRDPVTRRLQGATGEGASNVQPQTLVHERADNRALRIIEPFQRALTNSDPKQVGLARQRLIEGGFYRPSAVEVYYSIRIAAGIGFSILAALALFFLLPGTSTVMSMFYVVSAAAIGYYGPAFLLTSNVLERRKEFRLGMPDALDMILVGVEAGLSMPAALKHVCREFGDSHPVVAEQFQNVVLEFQAGKSRADALHGLARRMNVPETRTFAAMVVQAESLGTSLAQTLRVMADEMRQKRMLEAEKKASELPVKMAIPLVFCIFPALMAVVMVPAILQTLTIFANL